MKISHKFVKNIPDKIEEGVVYISIEYATAIHKCFCGCGNEVVTPFSPTDWELIFNGKTISIYPSVGNWNFDCRSHYWITSNQVKWAPKWTKGQIERGVDSDRKNKKEYYSAKDRKSIFSFLNKK
ncbi:MAG: DUF6527 family protein [Patescibacteria group bacterium]|jgi:hypothetical protein